MAPYINAAPKGGAGSQCSLGGAEHRHNSQQTLKSQGPWPLSRAYEQQSRDLCRSALTMRGADRFNALALASAYAFAAREAALTRGAA